MNEDLLKEEDKNNIVEYFEIINYLQK